MLALKLYKKYDAERSRAAKRVMSYEDTEEAKNEKLKIKKKKKS
tara:strand:+ start:304 stop:435 length:132 start_codon:yes stop_codon:yes gene_type:complete